MPVEAAPPGGVGGRGARASNAALGLGARPRAAVEHGAGLDRAVPVVELEPDGALRNTAFLLGRDGQEIGRYHKVNMPIHELNKQRGDHFPVFQTPDLGGVAADAKRKS